MTTPELADEQKSELARFKANYRRAVETKQSGHVLRMIAKRIQAIEPTWKPSSR